MRAFQLGNWHYDLSNWSQSFNIEFQLTPTILIQDLGLQLPHSLSEME